MVAYRARVYEKGDDEQIVDLLVTSFDGWPKFDIQCNSIEHWRWKYLDNPVGPLLIFVVEKEGVIVGSYHSVPRLVNIEGHTVLGSIDADVCTHPDHRRKGVYNMILDFLEPIIPRKDVIFWYGIESNPILIKKHIHDGTDKVAPHKAALYIRVKDLDRHLSVTSSNFSFIKKMGYRFFEKKNDFFNRASLRSNVSHYDIVRTYRFEKQVDDLFKKVKNYYHYIIERDSDYLNWRYCDPRGGDYHIWSAFHEKNLLGFVVSRINCYQEDYPTGHILDLIYDPTRLDVADALLKIALSDFDENKVNITHYLGITDNPLDTVVKSNGYVNSRKQILWTYEWLSPVTEYANIFKKLPSERVYFTYGDIDWI